MHFLLSGNVGVAAREIPSCMEIFFILSAGEVEGKYQYESSG